MNSESKGTFRVERWDEEIASEVDGAPTLKKARVEKIYTGEVEGRGVVEYLLVYTTETDATIYGIERFTGRVDDAHGSFLFEHKGTFKNGIAEMNWDIIDNSGTDGLKHIDGHVYFAAGMAKEYPITLNHYLQKEKHLWKKLLERRY